MSDQQQQLKRACFTTLSTTVALTNLVGSSTANSFSSTAAAASLRLGSDFLNSEDVNGTETTDRKNGNKTIRLNLELFQTDSSSYPEFNYSKLVHLEKRKLKKLKQKSSNGVPNPFPENDIEVARIAKELEKKYGSSYGSGRGKSKKDDHCDIGMGYDESDSFIDNTEAYDEVIPEEVETLEGGFYINCGALVFKEFKQLKTKTDEIIKMPNKPKKRILSTSSSSNGENDNDNDESDEDDDDDDDDDEDDDEETEDDVSVEETSSDIKKKSSKSNSTEKSQKPKVAITSKIKCPDNDKKKDKSGHTSYSSTSNSPRPQIEEINSDSDKDRARQKIISQKTTTVTTVKEILKAKRDSFRKMRVDGETKTVNGELKGAASKSSEESSSDSDDSSDDSDSNQSDMKSNEHKVKKSTDTEEIFSEKLRSTDTKLPELEPEMLGSIQQFKDIIRSKNMVDKKFQFDEKLTEVFLKIDEQLLCLEKAHRTMVFAHLEYNFSLPKYYFLRKAKQLRIKEEKMKSKRVLNKLRKAVAEVMPTLVANFELQIQMHSKMLTERPEITLKVPRKKFSWTTDLRNLLYDVYQVRWTSYPVLSTRKDNLESFISTYLNDKVLEIWPNGWMRYDELQKEIEKWKATAKKEKEKKKDLLNKPTTKANIPIPIIDITTTNPPIIATSNPMYMKMDDFATNRSGCNSDNDSVLSNKSLKRKNINMKQSKSKSQKTNGDQQQQQLVNNKIVPNTILTSLLDYNTLQKRIDMTVQNSNPNHIQNSIQNMMQTSLQNHMQNPMPISQHPQSSTSVIVPTLTAPNCINTSNNVLNLANNASIPMQQLQQLQQLQQKHSMINHHQPVTNSHIIDVDKFQSTNDILQTSKQILNAAAAQSLVPPSSESITIMPASKVIPKSTTENSSSESDCVEIVEVYPVKPIQGPIKQKSRKATVSKTSNNRPNSALMNNNNNNKNINIVTAESISPAVMEMNKVVKALKELEDLQHLQKARSSPQNNMSTGMHQ